MLAHLIKIRINLLNLAFTLPHISNWYEFGMKLLTCKFGYGLSASFLENWKEQKLLFNFQICVLGFPK